MSTVTNEELLARVAGRNVCTEFLKTVAALPDLLIIDWEMPLIDGPELVRMIRMPGRFPIPDIPIIILSAHSDHRRVVESARIDEARAVVRPILSRRAERRLASRFGWHLHVFARKPERG